MFLKLFRANPAQKIDCYVNRKDYDMARISQFEFASGDSYEIALTPDEYTDYLAGTLNLSIAHYTNDGMVMLTSGVPVVKDLTLANTTDHGYDADTNEYVISTSAPGGNWNPLPGGGGRYQGYALYSDDGTTTTVWDARYEALTTADVSQYELVAQNGPIAGTTLTFDNHSVAGNGNSSIYDQTTGGIVYRQGNDAFGDAGTGVSCLTGGTLISTPKGNIAVEDLSSGDLVNTVLNGPQKLRMVIRKRARAKGKSAPVKICKGALGERLPERDLWVSRQHRMLISSPVVAKLTGSQSTLIAAIKLTRLPGIFVDDSADLVEYFHLVFDKFELVIAEGARTESFYLGPMGLKALSAHERRKIFELFPMVSLPNYTPEECPLIQPSATQKEIVENLVHTE